jgi:hypothetical protein
MTTIGSTGSSELHDFEKGENSKTYKLLVTSSYYPPAFDPPGYDPSLFWSCTVSVDSSELEWMINHWQSGGLIG